MKIEIEIHEFIKFKTLTAWHPYWDENREKYKGKNILVQGHLEGGSIELCCYPKDTKEHPDLMFFKNESIIKQTCIRQLYKTSNTV